MRELGAGECKKAVRVGDANSKLPDVECENWSQASVKKLFLRVMQIANYLALNARIRYRRV